MPLEMGNAVARQRYKIFKRMQKAVRDKIKNGGYYGLGEEAAARLRKGYDPLIELAVFACDPQNPLPVRMAAHIEAAKYVHAPLKAIEIAGNGLTDGAPIQVAVLQFGSAQAALPMKVAAKVADAEAVEVEAVEVAADGSNPDA